MPQNKLRTHTDSWYYLGMILLIIFIAGPMVWVLGYSLLYSLGWIGLFSEGWTGAHWGDGIFSRGAGFQPVLYSVNRRDCDPAGHVDFSHDCDLQSTFAIGPAGCCRALPDHGYSFYSDGSYGLPGF